MPFSMPQIPLATDSPKPEATAAKAGAEDVASRSDHQHPRLTSTTLGSLNASNEATIVFTRSFASKPGLSVTYEEATDGMPISFKVKSWTQDKDGNYTGCTVKGYRATLLPTMSGIILIGPLISALSNLNIFGGSAAGVQFSIIAVQQST